MELPVGRDARQSEGGFHRAREVARRAGEVAVVAPARLDVAVHAELLPFLQALDLRQVGLQRLAPLLVGRPSLQPPELQLREIERAHAQVGAPELQARAVEVGVAVEGALEGEGGDLEAAGLERRHAEPVVELDLPGAGAGERLEERVRGGGVLLLDECPGPRDGIGSLGGRRRGKKSHNEDGGGRYRGGAGRNCAHGAPQVFSFFDGWCLARILAALFLFATDRGRVWDLRFTHDSWGHLRAGSFPHNECPVSRRSPAERIPP